MTVAELIEALRSYPADLQVLNGDFEAPTVERTTLYWAPGIADKGFGGEFRSSGDSRFDLQGINDATAVAEPKPIPTNVVLID